MESISDLLSIIVLCAFVLAGICFLLFLMDPRHQEKKEKRKEKEYELLSELQDEDSDENGESPYFD